MLLGEPVGVVDGTRWDWGGPWEWHWGGPWRGFPLGVVGPGPPMDASSRFSILAPLPGPG